MATKSSVEQSFLEAFESNMGNPVNMDKLGIGYKAFMESGNINIVDGLAVYDPTQPYGVVWDEASDTYSRVGHSIPAVQQRFKRVVTIGNPQFGGSVYKYLDINNSSLFEDGSDASAYVTRPDGAYQVMVEIPKCYTAMYKIGTLNYYWMSLTPFEKGTTHTAFRMSGWVDSGDGTDEDNEADYTYISAFEGVLYDASAASCIDGTGDSDTTSLIDTGSDKLISTAGYKPFTGITIVEGRTLVSNGSGKQFDWHRYSLMRLAFIVEYMTHDSQEVIPGYTENTSGPSYANDAMKTGLTLSLGNYSGSVSGSLNHITGGGDGGFSGVVANSYRGIENFFGHLWQWTDAVNITDRIPYVCGIDDVFASDSFIAPYILSGDQQPTSNGYQSELQDGTFFVKTIGASSTSKITDYYYQSTGNRVLRSGGGLDYSATAGVGSLRANSGSSTSSWDFCSRA